MRHGKSYKKLGVKHEHRRAMLRNMATSFFKTGSIVTTLTRAKALKPIVERLITKGKKGSLASKRQIASYLFAKESGQRVWGEIADRMQDRNGGYTRIVKHGPRFGDGAEMCQLQLVDFRDAAAKEAK